MKKLLLLISIAACYCSCDVNTKSGKSSDDATDVPASKWNYSDQVDEMTSKKVHYATLDSDDKLYFTSKDRYSYTDRRNRRRIRKTYEPAFPEITIRNRDNENEVMFEVSNPLSKEWNGHFYAAQNGEATLKIRFDDKEPQTFSASFPEDGSRDLVFIDQAEKVIRQLKGTKKVLVQASFDGGRTEIMHFNSAGLKWDFGKAAYGKVHGKHKKHYS